MAGGPPSINSEREDPGEAKTSPLRNLSIPDKIRERIVKSYRGKNSFEKMAR